MALNFLIRLQVVINWRLVSIRLVSFSLTALKLSLMRERKLRAADEIFTNFFVIE